jgi:hypothetical protein
MLLAFRTSAQADAAKQALGDALLRGDFATPARWLAAVAAIAPPATYRWNRYRMQSSLRIRASIQEADLALPTGAAPKASHTPRA